jgi:hypothetical protein
MPLYVHDQPVVGPTTFFGRQLLMRSLAKGLDAGRSFALIGGPKTGKSSVLATLAATLTERRVRDPKAVKVVPVQFDMAIVLGTAASDWIGQLWQAVEAAVTDPHVLGQSPRPRLPANPFASKENPWQTYRNQARELWRQTSGMPAWARYVLLLDNIDELVMRRQYKALHELGGFLNEKGPQAPLAAVLTGGRFLCEYIAGKDVPLHQLRTAFLSSLTPADADALIRLGFPDLTPEDSDGIMAETGCHPYLLCRLLAELERVGSRVDLTFGLRAMHADCQDLFPRIWKELDLNRDVAFRGMYAAPEHALMQMLIRRNDRVSLSQAEKELGIKPLKEYGEMLCYEGIVEKALVCDQPVFSSSCGLWNLWYNDRLDR